MNKKLKIVYLAGHDRKVNSWHYNLMGNLTTKNGFRLSEHSKSHLTNA